MLNDMKTNVNDVTTVVKNHNETAKSYASVLSEIKDTTNEMKKMKIARPLVPKSVSGAKTPNRKNDFPSLDERTPKRKRTNEPIETPKQKLFKDRKCGTNEANNNNNNSLGSLVNLVRSKKISPYAHMTKSLYISRLKNNVTIDKITEYIVSNVADAKLEDFAINLLVKKDQALDALSFLSIRLRCTPDYYDIFKNSSFWPSHIMIGEFIETSYIW